MYPNMEQIQNLDSQNNLRMANNEENNGFRANNLTSSVLKSPKKWLDNHYK